jgi:hypothetical protein
VSRQPITLDTLALAISSLRQKGPHPNVANDLAIDVVPAVRALADAARAAGKVLDELLRDHATEADWSALIALGSALAAFDAGRAPAPLSPVERDEPIPGTDDLDEINRKPQGEPA